MEILYAALCGFITGFIICIPVGPLNVWVMKTYINKGSLLALMIALGGSIMDYFYFMLILTGLRAINLTDSMQRNIQMGGVVLIFILGFKELLLPKVSTKESVNKIPLTSLFKYFLLGVFLYISNPTLIITMSSIAAFLESLDLYTSQLTNHVIVSLFLCLGTFSWFVTLIFILKKFQHKITQERLTLFNRFSGGLLIFLGILLLFKL